VTLTPRETQLRSALWLCTITVAWNVLVGTAAIATGVVTGSLAVAGYGLEAVIDSVASSMLIWRFRTERVSPERAELAEAWTLRVVGWTLVVAGVYLIALALRSLVAATGPRSSSLGIILTVSSLVVLPPLAYAKLRRARELGSRALRGDAVLTAAGALLAGAALVGRILDETLGWWWSDHLAALAIAVVLLAQGVHMLRDKQQVPLID
jgi:divalent metal cation (Fe/Co/Zn/Cd) transporter